jgi:hypothetical protein
VAAAAEYPGDVQTITRDNFGPLIAYILPGFVALVGVSYFSPTVESWLAASPLFAPTVGGFLYLTLGSTAAGLIVSAVRWAIVDTIYHHTGIPEPTWKFSRLPDKLDAFLAIVDNHYRYFQFYANMLVAMSFAYAAGLTAASIAVQRLWVHAGFIIVWVILLAGSRDALRKYYARGSDLLETGGTATRLGRVPRKKPAPLRTQ